MSRGVLVYYLPDARDCGQKQSFSRRHTSESNLAKKTYTQGTSNTVSLCEWCSMLADCCKRAPSLLTAMMCKSVSENWPHGMTIANPGALLMNGSTDFRWLRAAGRRKGKKQ
jgi:hypothetical protein